MIRSRCRSSSFSALVFLLSSLSYLSKTWAFQPCCGVVARRLGRTPQTPTALRASPLMLDNSLATLIAFFPTTGHEHQGQFVNAFSSSLMPTLKKEPGFISCHIHTSVDGSKVALFEEWASTESCMHSYSEESLATAVRVSLKYILQVEEYLVDRHLYQIVGATNHFITLDDPSIPYISFSEFSCTSFERQSELAAATSQHLNELPGGVRTATVLQSTDGTKVIVYGQWDQEEGFHYEKGYWDNVAPGNQHHLYSLVSSHEK